MTVRAGAIALLLTLTGCGRDPMADLVDRCVTKAGAWRYGAARANLVLLTVDEDPLSRPDSARSARVLDAPVAASWMLEHGLLAVEYPLESTRGFDTVGRLSLRLEGDARCTAFRNDPEISEASRRLRLTPEQGFCVGLERPATRKARYAVAAFERASDGAIMNELIDLQERRVLARVTNFLEAAGGPSARSCADTPKGAPTANPMIFVLASLQPEPGVGPPD